MQNKRQADATKQGMNSRWNWKKCYFWSSCLCGHDKLSYFVKCCALLSCDFHNKIHFYVSPFCCHKFYGCRERLSSKCLQQNSHQVENSPAASEDTIVVSPLCCIIVCVSVCHRVALSCLVGQTGCADLSGRLCQWRRLWAKMQRLTWKQLLVWLTTVRAIKTDLSV